MRALRFLPSFCRFPANARRAVMFMTLFTSACNSSMKTPDIKRNPHPSMRYEIILTSRDAPGPFDSVSGYMQHQLLDKRCVPESPWEGVRAMPDAPIHFAFTRRSDREYVGTVYLDLLQDENYFGLGVCHWTMTLVGASIKAGAAAFAVSISMEDIVAGRPVLAYLPKQAYFEGSDAVAGSEGAIRLDKSISGMPAGTPVAEYAAEHPDEFFTVTLTGSAVHR
jgi:hypothetical protein